MKRKLAIAAIAVAMVVTTVGCSSSASNSNISISKYKGVEIDKVTETKVDDNAVEENINATLEAQGTTEEITDRTDVQKDDTANINYVGKVDGAEFEGGSSDAYDLEIGSGQFIEGFEDQLIGHKVGETFDINVTFPEDYDESLAGKEAVFTVTINKISKSVPAELTDEFVQSVSENSKTVEEYKKEVKEELKTSSKEEYSSAIKDAAWQVVMDNTKVKKYDEDRIKELEDSYKQYYTEMATSYGVEYEDMLTNYLGISEEDFNKQVSQAAKEYAKEEMAVELIGKKQKLTPTDKEYEEAYKKMAEDYGYADVDTMMEASSEKDLQKTVLSDIVKEWVAEHAKQVKAKEKTSSDGSADATTNTKEESTSDGTTDSAE